MDCTRCFLSPISLLKCTMWKKRVYDYDFVVIGGGSGGFAAAMEAASFGAKTVILDKCPQSEQDYQWDLGGTCLNAGGIAWNMAYWASQRNLQLHEAKFYGWSMPSEEFVALNWRDLIDGIRGFIQRTSVQMSIDLKKANIDYLHCSASFKDSHSIYAHSEFGGRRVITGKYILIATGSRPKLLPIPGIEHCMTSDDILTMKQPPKKCLVIGCGPLGLLCASILNGFKIQVTVMCRNRPLKMLDQQMAEMVVNYLERRGIKFIKEVSPKLIHKLPNGIVRVFWYDRFQTLGVDFFNTVVLAVGRKPVTTDLNAHHIGIRFCDQGTHIKTNHEQTSISHIFAVGDVTCKKPQFCAVAAKAGKLLARRLFGGMTMYMDYDSVPGHLFLFPEYAWVGVSEEAAIAKYGESNLEIYHSYFHPIEFTITKRNVDLCYAKVIAFRKGEQKVLGMHMLGPHAGELIQGFAVALYTNRLTVKNLRATIGIWATTAIQFVMIDITKRSGLYPYNQRSLT